LKEWVASDLSGLDLLVIQIDGIHMDEDLILVAAMSFWRGGFGPPFFLGGNLPPNAQNPQKCPLADLRLSLVTPPPFSGHNQTKTVSPLV
jgi:hypothetical protein